MADEDDTGKKDENDVRDCKCCIQERNVEEEVNEVTHLSHCGILLF